MLCPLALLLYNLAPSTRARALAELLPPRHTPRPAVLAAQHLGPLVLGSTSSSGSGRAAGVLVSAVGAVSGCTCGARVCVDVWATARALSVTSRDCCAAVLVTQSTVTTACPSSTSTACSVGIALHCIGQAPLPPRAPLQQLLGLSCTSHPIGLLVFEAGLQSGGMSQARGRTIRSSRAGARPRRRRRRRRRQRPNECLSS